MPKFTSQILLLFSTILHILGKLFLKDFTRLKVVSCLGSHGENTAFLFLGQTTMKKPLRRKPSGWRRKAFFSLLRLSLLDVFIEAYHFDRIRSCLLKSCYRTQLTLLINSGKLRKINWIRNIGRGNIRLGRL